MPRDRSINRLAVDAVLLHAHKTAWFERHALELFAEAALLEFSRLIEDDHYPTRREIEQVVDVAVGAAIEALRDPLVELILSVRRDIGGALRRASGDILREQFDPTTGLKPGQIFRRMDRDRAERLLDTAFRDSKSVLNTYDLSPTMQRRVKAQLTADFAAGVTPRTSIANVRDIIGEERHYETFVRTAVQEVNNRAADQLHEDNRDVLNGVQYLASLDDRTCLVCGGYDGRKYWFQPTKGEASYEGRPRLPEHFRCRCTYSPVVKSLRELGITRKQVPDRVAKTMTGRAERRTLYPAWLARQAPELQRQILGTKRHEMYRKGMPVEKFTARGKIVDVDDLRIAGKLKSRSVSIPETTEKASELATAGLRAKETRYVTQRVNPLASESGMELITERTTARYVEDAIRNLPPSAQREARLRVGVKYRYERTPTGIVRTQVEATHVTKLGRSQLESMARKVADTAPNPEIRVRGARLGWRKRNLKVTKARGGYVEKYTAQKQPGTAAVEVYRPPPRAITGRVPPTGPSLTPQQQAKQVYDRVVGEGAARVKNLESRMRKLERLQPENLEQLKLLLQRAQAVRGPMPRELRREWQRERLARLHIERLRRKIADQIKPLMEAEDIQQIAINYGGRKANWARKAPVRKAVKDARDWTQSMLANQGGKLRLTANAGRAGSRAYYHKIEKAIYLPDASTKGALHEIGHFIEHSSEGRRALARRFLARRTKGESARSLNAIAKQRGTGIKYRAGEKAKPDKFFDPYCGKTIELKGKITDTECISKGLERLYTDPLAFARQDPDYFRFVLQVLRTP